MNDYALLVGASGWLGNQIADALIARNIALRVALRGGGQHPKAAAFRGRAEIIHADLDEPHSLSAAVDGVKVIVSAVQGGREQIVDGQIALAKVGLAAGVLRMIPSDFAVDFRGVGPEHHLFLGWRNEADQAIAALGMPQANIYNGAFTEMLLQPFFGLLDRDANRVRYWGDVDQPYDFTMTRDIAAFAGAVVADPARLGPQMIAGDTTSPRQLAETASAVFGSTFTLDRLGSLAALDAEIERLRAVSPNDPMGWVGLQYHRLMASGDGKLDLVDAINSNNVTNVRGFLGQAS